MFLQGFLVSSSFLVGLINGGVKIAPPLTVPAVKPVATLRVSDVQAILLKPVQVNGIELKPAQPTVVKTFTVGDGTIL